MFFNNRSFPLLKVLTFTTTELFVVPHRKGKKVVFLHRSIQEINGFILIKVASAKHLIMTCLEVITVFTSRNLGSHQGI